MITKKELILEGLEGKRTERVFDLIRRALIEIYTSTEVEVNKIMEEIKEDYTDYEEQINDEKNRYMIIEQYNIEEGFYCRIYKDGASYEEMFDGYFSDSGGGWEQILLVDMKENKCYLLDKKVKYTKQKVDIKEN